VLARSYRACTILCVDLESAEFRAADEISFQTSQDYSAKVAQDLPIPTRRTSRIPAA
jgi:hypothetical protein